MSPELIAQLPSLGISGLLFVMWWMERADRVKAAESLRDSAQTAAQMVAITDRLLEVIRSNTTALTELRDELRSHRAAEIEWRSKLARQLERNASQTPAIRNGGTK